MPTEVREEPKTYGDYLALGEGAPYQLIGGKLVMTPSPSIQHQSVAKKLLVRFYQTVELEKKTGVVLGAPVDVYFDEHEVYQPDIIFVLQSRLSILETEKVNGAPDLVVEILSPSNAYYDLRHKKDVYAAHGVKEYWIVDPVERSIEVYENVQGTLQLFFRTVEKGMVESRVVPDIGIRCEEIF